MKTVTSLFLITLFLLTGIPKVCPAQNCVKTAPFTEVFGDNYLTTGSPWQIEPMFMLRNVDTCWEVNSGNFPKGWTLGLLHPADTGRGRLDSSGFWSSSYLFVRKVGNNPGNWEDFATPWIDVSALQKPELSFDYHLYGRDIDRLLIMGKSKGDTLYQPLDSILGEHQTSMWELYEKYAVPLQALSGDTVKIKFRFYSKARGNCKCHATVDNFAIREASPCLPPVFPGLAVQSPTSVQVQWQNSANHQQVEIEYGLLGHTQNTRQSQFVQGNSQTLRNLQDGLTYQLKIRSICGTDTSAWQWRKVFSLPCQNRIKSFPYRETMDQWTPDTINGVRKSIRGKISSCWQQLGRVIPSRPSLDSAYSWLTFKPRSSATTPNDISGNGLFTFSSGISNTASSSDKLFHTLSTPKISLGQAVNPELSFWVHSIDSDPNRLDTTDTPFLIVLAQEQNKSAQPIDTIQGPIQKKVNDPWQEYRYDLSAYGGDTVRISFRVEHNGNPGPANDPFLLDEVHFREKPGCALAGQDSLVQLCDSLGSYDLSNLLDSNNTGGVWQDINGSGALSGTLLNLGQLPQDSAFPFRYLIPKDSACSADSATYTIIRNKAGCSIGLEEYQTPGLDIFPNPARERLYLRPQNSGVQWGEVALYNLQGQRQKVELSQHATGVSELSLAGLAPGVYFLTVELEGKKVVRKVVVE